MEESGSVMFPLEATVQSHSTLLFGYVADIGTGAVVPLDLTNAPVAGLDTWLRNGGSSQAASTNKRVVLALFDLTMHEPTDDFQPKAPAPKGPGMTARLYPLLSLWCANPCDEAAGDFAMTRPTTSAMTGQGMFPGSAINGSFFTDSNDHIRKIWEDLSPYVRQQLTSPPTGITILDAVQLAALIGAWKVLPSPRWNSLFAHYRLGGNLPPTKVVDRTKGTRTRSDVREEMETDRSVYIPKDVTKVAGQGAFDNIHIAPAMDYQGQAAAMAPICQHDCLHLHWRWSTLFSDKPLSGWRGGVPYAAAGAPMIPENQDLVVSFTGTTFEYQPVATGVDAMKWQVFMHHGMAYLTEMKFPGTRLPAMEATSFTELYLSAPPWEQFYYHNQFWESLGTDRSADKPRIRPGAGRTTFTDAENM